MGQFISGILAGIVEDCQSSATFFQTLGVMRFNTLVRVVTALKVTIKTRCACRGCRQGSHHPTARWSGEREGFNGKQFK